jgi:hypothetical protein
MRSDDERVALSNKRWSPAPAGNVAQIRSVLGAGCDIDAQTGLL